MERDGGGIWLSQKGLHPTWCVGWGGGGCCREVFLVLSQANNFKKPRARTSGKLEISLTSFGNLSNQYMASKKLSLSLLSCILLQLIFGPLKYSRLKNTDLFNLCIVY